MNKYIGWFLVILVAIVAAIMIGRALAPGVDYDADMYVCGEPPDDVIFYCQVGTGPPRTDCGVKQSGVTQTEPIGC